MLFIVFITQITDMTCYHIMNIPAFIALASGSSGSSGSSGDYNSISHNSFLIESYEYNDFLRSITIFALTYMFILVIIIQTRYFI